MNKLVKRIALTASSVAVAGVAVLGAGGPALAVTAVSAPIHRPPAGITTADHQWDHGVGYLLEQGYSCDETRGWHQGDSGPGATRHDCDGLHYRDGHFYRWEGEGRG
ncbi:hypothetical protein ACIRU2_19265 [Streptomyces sp. NPDC101169]|uniref:hypothetical protein n=1 Tax=unclassified Streptomyces TaxID=2593676 RepID=UPI0037F42664